MPAWRARTRPGASGRFDNTIAIVALRSPRLIASMIDCRLLPRPEMRIASRRPG